jgi:hypothetical protein
MTPHQVVRSPRVRPTADVTAGQEPVSCSPDAANQVSSTLQLIKFVYEKAVASAEIMIFVFFPMLRSGSALGNRIRIQQQ